MLDKNEMQSGSEQIKDSASQRSFTSTRSKEETKKMYRKLQTMSKATAAILSTKMDYNSLKDLQKQSEESSLNQS